MEQAFYHCWHSDSHLHACQTHSGSISNLTRHAVHIFFSLLRSSLRFPLVFQLKDIQSALLLSFLFIQRHDNLKHVLGSEIGITVSVVFPGVFYKTTVDAPNYLLYDVKRICLFQPTPTICFLGEINSFTV